MEPISIFGFGVGIKIDHTTFYHILIYGGLVLGWRRPYVPYQNLFSILTLWWKARGEKQGGASVLAYPSRVYLSVYLSGLFSALFASMTAALAVEILQGYQYQWNKGNFFDPLELLISWASAILVFLFYYKRISRNE